MNIPQLTALCLRYHGVLLDASEEVEIGRAHV